jgi:hypothetical protein
MILSRWIKDERLNTEIDLQEVDQLDFGLKNDIGNSIRFVKYNFNSNNNTTSIYDWLSDGGYKDTQYIGFFNIDAIRDWLKFNLSFDYHSRFITKNYFIFKLNQVFSLNPSDRVIIREVTGLTINSSVTKVNNQLLYFTPPAYPVYNEDRSIRLYHSNPGEIDIVTSDMIVYGILCNHTTDLLYSKNYNLRKNYSDNNVRLINEVLDRLRTFNFTIPVDANLLNVIELEDIFTRKLQESFFDTLQNNLKNITNNNARIYINKFTKDNNGIQLKDEIKYTMKINQYPIIFRHVGITYNNVIISKQIDDYINEHFIGALLNIASFLNNSISRAETIEILNVVRQNQQPPLPLPPLPLPPLPLPLPPLPLPQAEQPQKIQRLLDGGNHLESTTIEYNSKHKYLKYKTKYLELKKKLNEFIS